MRVRYLRQEEGVDPPRKPLPRKKIPPNLCSLARGHTELCIKVLAGIVSQEAIPPAARVSAAGILLDRGWGKAAQPHTGEDGETIRVTIRTITEGAPPMPSCRVLRPVGSLGGGDPHHLRQIVDYRDKD
jgi:hypothetical protein